MDKTEPKDTFWGVMRECIVSLHESQQWRINQMLKEIDKVDKDEQREFNFGKDSEEKR